MSAAERIDGGGTPSLETPAVISKCKRRRLHVNNLWSIWYGVTFTGFQAYVAIQLSKRILDSIDGVPRAELQTCLVLTGLAIVLLPFFLLASILKIGNLANDGFKIGRTLSTCALDPDDSTASGPGGAMSLWRHSGPTAPFLHILIAFSLLLPNLFIQARRIQSNDLPRDYVWKSELDFITSQENRPVVLSFTTSTKSIENTTSRTSQIPTESTTPLPQSMMLTSENEPFFEVQEKWGPVSTEFFNYAVALAVYAVRYPAVFWNTNKYWGVIFSFQLLVNGIQSLLIYVGASIIYKVHVIGPNEVLTQLPSKYGAGFFLLNPHVTLALLVLTTFLVLSSSLVLYLYGYGRFQAFLTHEKACKVISVESREWGYLTHCAALCVLLAITVVEGPLLVDLAVVYKATMDSAVLVAVVGAVLHLFIWVVLWLILTLKQSWVFKLRITVGKAAVKSARSIKLLTDVELLSSCDSTAPLLVVASGRTYTVCDTSPKKTIVSAIHKAAMERKNRLQGSSTSSSKELYNDTDEQIYWLRPKPISPKNSPDSEVSDRVSWHKKVILKPRVTFDHTIRSGREYAEGDDGDYARLRELPLLGPKCRSNDIAQQMNGAKVQYISSKNILVPVVPSDYEEPSSLPAAEPSDLPPPPVLDAPATPRCLLRADSGMPHDLTPRSDSEASCSPPDHSETSSGVHSNSSRESHNHGNSQQGANHQDGSLIKPCSKWQTQTLQRTINPSVDVAGEVVIRRRVEPETIALTNTAQDKFGRSTNMKMTSFTDSQSATLPHFPTQQVGGAVPYPHCSTMPLPPVVPPMAPIQFNYPRHSTIPTHHNGVHLFTPNNFAKRPMVHRYPHNSFPQLMNPMKYGLSNTSERDSANFSMASSGDSDAYHS